MKSDIIVKNNPDQLRISADLIPPQEVIITPKEIELHDDCIIIKVDGWYNVKIIKNQAFADFFGGF